jgi:pimeloyl-CoA synthetase
VALDARDIPVTRQDVYDWIQEYGELPKSKKKGDKPDKEFVNKKLKDKGLEDVMVNTAGHENLGDETSLTNMILMDIDSYG